MIGIVVGEIPDEQLFAVGIDDAVSELIKTAESDTQSPSSDDHGDSRTAATAVALNSTVSGNIASASDLDYFRIEVNNPGTLSAFTTGNTDTIGILHNALGNIITIDDESGAGRNRVNAIATFSSGNTNAIQNTDSDEVRRNTLGNVSAITDEISSGSNFLISNELVPGTYYILVSHYRDDGVGSYNFHLEFKETTQLPDFVVNSINIARPSVIAGEKVLVHFSRNNLGGENSGEFKHGLYLSADSKITTKDMNLVNFYRDKSTRGKSRG